MKKKLIISINVHEKPEYLANQIANIKEFVLVDHEIILNCNHFMFEQVKKITNPRFIVNPEPFDKERFTGTLLKGMVFNLEYSIENYDFDYFLIMSSREFFHKKLESCSQIHENKLDNTLINYNISGWHWPAFKNTKLLKYIFDKKQKFSWSAHEGLCFDKKSCLHIHNFLSNNVEIKEDLFNFRSCVEEFALQTICCNKFDFFYVGNSTYVLNPTNFRPESLTHKRVR